MKPFLAQLPIPPQPETPNPEPGTQPSAAEDIRDIIPPDPVPDYLKIALIVVLASLTLCMIAGLAYLYLQRRRLARATPPAPPSPLDVARRKLENLRARIDSLSPNDLSLQASEIIKDYFHHRYGDPVRFETSEEFLLRDNVEKNLPPSKRAALADFLRQCDTLKYSRFPEALDLAAPLIDHAANLVEEQPAEPVTTTTPAPANHAQ